MSEYKLKKTKMEDKVVGAYKKIEDGVVNTYKTIEDGVVNTYKNIEDKFVREEFSWNFFICVLMN